jgi:hypothetical protein
LRHARIHVGVFVRFAGYRRLEVLRRLADRQTGRGIAHLFQILEVSVRVAGFTLGRGAEYR